MLKLDTEKRHSITITDPVTGATQTYECTTNPQESANRAIKTLRSLQNGNGNPKYIEKHKAFLNVPLERLQITITQHYNFQIGQVLNPYIVKQVLTRRDQINTRYEEHRNNKVQMTLS